jgi:hypothetical protein
MPRNLLSCADIYRLGLVRLQVRYEGTMRRHRKLYNMREIRGWDASEHPVQPRHKDEYMVTDEIYGGRKSHGRLPGRISTTLVIIIMNHALTTT